MSQIPSFVFLPEEVLTEKIESAVHRQFERWEKENNKSHSERCFTINSIAKRLGKNHSTIKKLCERGIIKTTKSGLITEQAINEYLSNV